MSTIHHRRLAGGPAFLQDTAICREEHRLCCRPHCMVPSAHVRAGRTHGFLVASRAHGKVLTARHTISNLPMVPPIRRHPWHLYRSARSWRIARSRTFPAPRALSKLRRHLHLIGSWNKENFTTYKNGETMCTTRKLWTEQPRRQEICRPGKGSRRDPNGSRKSQRNDRRLMRVAMDH